MALSRLIRKVASGDSVRHQEGEFDLNLTYITDRVIGMGFPASGVEGMYRNSIIDVAQFLIEKHQGNFMIYNLSSRKYDYSLFNEQVLEFGFPDHHNPPLLLLFGIVKSMHSWIAADNRNVAVVHCLAGKGRTGTVIACYLIYSGLFTDPTEALAHYAMKRSHLSKGVSHPSQKRYVEYFDAVCFTNQSYKPVKKKIELITLKPFPVGLITSKISIQIERLSNTCTETDSGVNVQVEELYNSGDPEIIDDMLLFYLDIPISGDIIIRCHQTSRLWRSVQLFRTSFHSAFIENNRIELTKNEIDLADKDDRFSEDFEFNIHFQDEKEVDAEKEEDEYLKADETYKNFFEAARKMRNEQLEKRASMNSSDGSADFYYMPRAKLMIYNDPHRKSLEVKPKASLESEDVAARDSAPLANGSDAPNPNITEEPTEERSAKKEEEKGNDGYQVLVSPSTNAPVASIANGQGHIFDDYESFTEDAVFI